VSKPKFQCEVIACRITLFVRLRDNGRYVCDKHWHLHTSRVYDVDSDVARENQQLARRQQSGALSTESKKEHEAGCPRLQFWDAGEWEAPCYCGHGEEED
jgi:hypothetical protein